MDWATETANRVVSNWVDELLPHVNAIEMAALRDRIALQLRIERRTERETLAQDLRAEEDRQYIEFHNKTSDPPHRMDLVNHWASDFIRARK